MTNVYHLPLIETSGAVHFAGIVEGLSLDAVKPPTESTSCVEVFPKNLSNDIASGRC